MSSEAITVKHKQSFVNIRSITTYIEFDENKCHGYLAIYDLKP